MTARDSSLSLSLKHVEEISTQLSPRTTISRLHPQNFRRASEELKNTLDDLAPDLKATGKNVNDLSATLRTQPWRLIIPSTKKYPEDQQQPSTQTITVRKSVKATPTPARHR